MGWLYVYADLDIVFLQNMSRALVELRADLVKQAEDAVRVNASNAAQDWNVQKLIDKRTKDLQQKIVELEDDLAKVIVTALYPVGCLFLVIILLNGMSCY